MGSVLDDEDEDEEMDDDEEELSERLLVVGPMLMLELLVDRMVVEPVDEAVDVDSEAGCTFGFTSSLAYLTIHG